MARFRILSTCLVAALVLGACAETPRQASPLRYAELLRPIEIGPGEASARLQYRRIVPRNGVQDTDPHCIFEIDTVKDTAQPIAPADFLVTGIEHRVETASGMPVMPMHGIGFWRDGGPSHVFYLTRFNLRDDGPAKARSLTCQHNQANAGVPRFLNPEEIQQALGDYIRLKTAR